MMRRLRQVYTMLSNIEREDLYPDPIYRDIMLDIKTVVESITKKVKPSDAKLD